MTTNKSGENENSEVPEQEPQATPVAAEPEGVAEEEANEVPQDPIEALEADLAAAQQEAGEARADMLRMQADMDNLRKRLVREHEKSRRRALERFMGDLLPVVDSMERGLEAAEDPASTVETLKEGKQLIQKMLTKAMTDHGLQVIDPINEPFDPEMQEAMAMLPSKEHDENTVIEVLEKGYRLHERLIRPAKVVVSRKP